MVMSTEAALIYEPLITCISSFRQSVVGPREELSGLLESQREGGSVTLPAPPSPLLCFRHEPPPAARPRYVRPYLFSLKSSEVRHLTSSSVVFPMCHSCVLVTVIVCGTGILSYLVIGKPPASLEFRGEALNIILIVFRMWHSCLLVPMLVCGTGILMVLLQGNCQGLRVQKRGTQYPRRLISGTLVC